MTLKDTVNKTTRAVVSTLEWLVEHLGTFLYREMLKRNTLRPMEKIIQEHDPDRQRRLVREWAYIKANECSYVQLAGGFLFTTAASCLQWPGVQNGHWSASALMYASILLSLIAIVSGSQELLVLPTERQSYDRNDMGSRPPLPQQTSSSSSLPSRKENEPDGTTKSPLETVVERLRWTSRDGRPNTLHVIALQAPIMFLALAVLAFLSGLCSVVFAPLVRQPTWNEDAKIAVLFGTVAILCVLVFMLTSLIIHGLFSLQQDSRSRVGSYLVHIKA